jgi:predicted nucleotidyltransferase
MKIKVKSDLFDLSIKKELNQSIWDGEKLNMLVRERLLKIADDFIKDLEIVERDEVEDIRLTGSLANYNYTSYSDIDLHVIVDFQKLSADAKFIESFFKNKRTIWNEQHDITIKGFDVELYVEDDNEEHHSTGIYSVLNDQWFKKPKPTKKKIDKKAVLKKAKDITGRFKDLVEEGGTESTYRKLFKKIIDMRKAGLEKEGEYSVENLAFKILRRAGVIKKIVDTFKDLHDRLLTLDERRLLIYDEI